LIRFEAPAAPASIRLARLLATGVASALDFTVDDLEDVAIAVDELCFVVVGSEPVDGTIRLSFAVEGGELCVDGAAPDHGQPGTLSAFSSRIVSATAASSEVWRDGEDLHFRLRCAARPAGGRPATLSGDDPVTLGGRKRRDGPS
jgi:hypothetical protein